MPGIMPAGATVVRMGMSAIKGIAQDWNFKNYLRDLTGVKDLRHAYLPSMTAPKEMKDFAAEYLSKVGVTAVGGYDAFRAAFEQQFAGKKFDDYFVDAMQKDWLISDTMVKTPFLKEDG
jgi:hypothetical protein